MTEGDKSAVSGDDAAAGKPAAVAAGANSAVAGGELSSTAVTSPSLSQTAAPAPVSPASATTSTASLPDASAQGVPQSKSKSTPKVRRMVVIEGPPSHRKSSRSHKRKKFDDEILEIPHVEKRKKKDAAISKDSASTKGGAVGANNSTSRGVTVADNDQPKRSRSSGKASRATSTATSGNSDQQLPASVRANVGRRDLMTTASVPTTTAAASKRSRSGSNAGHAAVESVAPARIQPPPLRGDPASQRWSPEDDFRLMVNMHAIPDPMVIRHSVKFTREFTLQDIKERWFGMLYDADTCRTATSGMAVLDEEERRMFQSSALFSADEENDLRSLRPGPDGAMPSIQQFEELMHKRPWVFAPGRTAAKLRAHWARMQHMQLLNADPSCGRLGRMMQGTPAAANAAELAAQAQTNYCFADACRQLTPKTISKISGADTGPDAVVARQVDRELEGVDRKNKRKIRKLEHQIALWRSFDDLGIQLPSPSSAFDSTTLAILRGNKLEYRMRSRQIVAGRRAAGAEVDVDLTEEDAAPSRISRAQFLVKLRHDRHFYLTNLGKRPTYVNGQPVLRGARCRLFANSVIEVCSVALLFTVNDDLMRALRAEV